MITYWTVRRRVSMPRWTWTFDGVKFDLSDARKAAGSLQGVYVDGLAGQWLGEMHPAVGDVESDELFEL